MTRAVCSFTGDSLFRAVVVNVFAAFCLAGCVENAWGQSPDVGVGYCDPNSAAQDVTLLLFSGELEVGLPLPRSFC